MSATEVQTGIEQQKTAVKRDAEKIQVKRGPPYNFTKKHKHDFKNNRKRSQSFSGSGKIFLFKKRKKESTLPSKFLLGGNICDPLNLNSLQDEEINRAMNAVTPKSSPLPTPPRRRAQIEVIIPPNICDPLNLIGYTDDATYEKQLSSPIKRGRKKNNRKNKRNSLNSSETSENNNSTNNVAQTPEGKQDSAKIPDINTPSAEPATETSPTKDKVVKNLTLELPSPPVKDKPSKRKSTDEGKDVKKVRRVDAMDKIVSPVIPQPGAWKRPPNFNWGGGNNGKVVSKAKQTIPEKMPVFKEKSKQYQYGNYNRYYGYRNPHHEVDMRLKCFSAHRGMFLGKDVLDIGCNIGHVTLSIARDFGAKSVVGLDIDKMLINIARKNVCYYVNCNSDSPGGDGITQAINRKGKKGGDKFFPISMPILYGPVDVPGMSKMEKGKGFPHNVTFVQGNYILEDDALLSMEHPQFDVILALSITKWIHLNWGDTGLKQAFRRMYAQLRPGGRLILEPQAWSSYVKKKALTETTFKHYKSIEFFPQQFTQYLLSSEVGFAKSEVMGCPSHHSKGFQRPIFVFTKSNLSPMYSQRSDTSTPSFSLASATFQNRVYTNCVPSPLCLNDASQDSSQLSSDAVNHTNESASLLKPCDKTVVPPTSTVTNAGKSAPANTELSPSNSTVAASDVKVVTEDTVKQSANNVADAAGDTSTKPVCKNADDLTPNEHT